jgi:hypothetical protein
MIDVKRLRRVAWNWLVLLSAISCLAMTWFWLSGYIQGWWGIWEVRTTDIGTLVTCKIYIGGGGLSLEYMDERLLADEQLAPESFRVPLEKPQPERRFNRYGGNDYPAPPRWASGASAAWRTYSSRPFAYKRGILILHCWMVVAIMALPSILWLGRRRRARMIASDGRCVICGYDLRATPNKCPECGTVPPAKPAGQT